MYCKNCGEQIDSDSKFCSHCGAKQSITHKQDRKTISNYTEKPNDPFIIQNITDLKYDPYYQKDFWPIVIGVILIILNILSIVFNPDIDQDAVSIIFVILFVIRLAFASWIFNLAKKLNRNSNSWAVFGFFFTAIALIIIGVLRKLTYSRNYNYFSEKEKGIENDELAYNLYEKSKYEEALIFSNKSISLFPDNPVALETRGIIKYLLADFKGALEDINSSIEMDPRQPSKYYYRGNIYKDMGDLESAKNNWEVSANKGSIKAKNALKDNSMI